MNSTYLVNLPAFGKSDMIAVTTSNPGIGGNGRQTHMLVQRTHSARDFMPMNAAKKSRIERKRERSG